MGISNFFVDVSLARIEIVGLFCISSNKYADSEIEFKNLDFTKSTKILEKYLAAVRKSRIVVRVNDSVDK